MNELVWFKRDLRVRDHVALARASEAAQQSGGGLICLFVYETEWLRAPETDGSHVRFVNESLRDLDEALCRCGGRLVTRVGHMIDVLRSIHDGIGFARLWSHEETGSDWTFQRDRRVADWCRAEGVRWVEVPQNGVIRRLRSRDGWSAEWERRMQGSPEEVRRIDSSVVEGWSAGIVSEAELGVSTASKECQVGGERMAWRTLESFLMERGVDYRRGMSSPLTGGVACSRLSPYLAWGCISLREVTSATDERLATLREERGSGVLVDPRWLGSLRSFSARLRWHCHFMQKLEDEPSLEFENLHRGYDGLRDEMTRSEEGRRRFSLWTEGRTGYPMIDACIRSCLATGWLNFRMRAMVASFAGYHLWLHWRQPAVFLARHFLDFEAGIHFPQFQMQSGTTGINTLRIYSPAKQARDQDPEGMFIRRWVPELEGVPLEYLAEPHLMSEGMQVRSGCKIGSDYPFPVVDHRRAYVEAKGRFSVLRRSESIREEARAVYDRHGSRKQPIRQEFGGRRSGAQMELSLGE